MFESQILSPEKKKEKQREGNGTSTDGSTS